MLNLIKAVEVDAMLTLGIIILFVAAVLSMLSNRLEGSSENLFWKLGNNITFIAIIPLTIHVTTHVFPTLFQQFVVSFLVIAAFAYDDVVRLPVQFIASIIVAIAAEIVFLPFNILSYTYNFILRKMNSAAEESID